MPQFAAAVMRYSRESTDFQNAMRSLSEELQIRMHKLKADEMGLTLEEFYKRMENLDGAQVPESSINSK